MQRAKARIVALRGQVMTQADAKAAAVRASEGNGLGIGNQIETAPTPAPPSNSPMVRAC